MSTLALANERLTTSVQDLVLNAGPVAKFVLIILGIFSVICWAFIFEKGWQFLRIRSQTNRFLKAFRTLGNSLWVNEIGSSSTELTTGDCRESPLAQLYIAARQEITDKTAFGLAGKPALSLAGKVNTESFDAANRAMRKAASSQIRRMERFLPFLATTASASPFIGLFGTVWGVMESFRGIGSQGSASLAVVAPGISEALIATAAGLGAAIPAVMAYNFFVSRVKHWATEIEGFSLELLNLFERFSFGASRCDDRDRSVGAGRLEQIEANPPEIGEVSKISRTS